MFLKYSFHYYKLHISYINYYLCQIATTTHIETMIELNNIKLEVFSLIINILIQSR